MLAITTRLSFRSRVAVLVVACLLASVAACDVGSPRRVAGSTDTPATSAARGATPSTTRPDDGPVADGDLGAWMEEMCAAAVPAYELAHDESDRLTSGADDEAPDELLAGLLAAMNRIDGAFEQAVADVGALGPAPLADGQTVAHSLTQLFSTTGLVFSATARVLGYTEEKAPGAVEEYDRIVRNFSLQVSRTTDALRDRFGSPELKTAYGAAPSCQRLAPLLDLS